MSQQQSELIELPDMENDMILNDIVHGIIKIPPYIKAIIDTTPFQRLRSISQLGIANYVYPSASYSRFDHCIGTFHLASKLVKKLKNQICTEGLGTLLSDDEKKCIEIAALCHDLGHGPYSHMWEHMALQNLKIDISEHKTHEELSVEILGDILNIKRNNENKTIRQNMNLNDDSVELIGRIILGKYDKEKDKKRKFIFEIVANKISGLDVDKFDYICRDSIYLGWSNKNKILDIERILNFYRIAKDESGEWRLAMRDREIFHIHDIFYTRHMLHRYAYQHKTLKGLECMFKNAMKKILTDHGEELIENVTGIKECKSDSMLCSKEFISKACDYHIWDMMKKHCPSIITKINERCLYKLFCKLQIKINGISKNELNDDMNALEYLVNKIKRTPYVYITTSMFSLRSEREGDPMLLVPFYKKYSPNECFAFENHRNSLPKLVELVSDEWIVMIFTERDIEEASTAYLNLVKSILCGVKEPSDGPEGLKRYVDKYKFSELQY